MAHKTRKRLTKTELKKDPVNEFLMGTMTFLKEHLTMIAATLGALVIVILIVQSFSESASRQSNEATAGYYLAGQLYQLGMSSFQSGQYETALGQLQTAMTVAQNNYRAYPGRQDGRRSALLDAKIGIIFGLEDQVIPQLGDFIASRPDEALTNTARLYMATALENRGGTNDLINARDAYDEILASVDPGSQLAWQAYTGLARLAFETDDFENARRNLDSALAIFPDTTEFMEYQLARLDYAGF